MINKIKITEDNVKNLHENVLYAQIELYEEGSLEFILIDAELDRKAAIVAQALSDSKMKQIEIEQMINQYKTDIHEAFSKETGPMSFKLIEKLDPTIFDNYSLCLVTFTVKSFVAQRHQNNEWVYDTESEAKNHYRDLVYTCFYDRYMRNAQLAALKKMKDILGSL